MLNSVNSRRLLLKHVIHKFQHTVFKNKLYFILNYMNENEKGYSSYELEFKQNINKVKLVSNTFQFGAS